MAEDPSCPSIAHVGNTANNAFYNHLILMRSSKFTSLLPIEGFIRHAISSPAWEMVNFIVPSEQWVKAPEWQDFPEALELNNSYLRFKSAHEITGPVPKPTGNGVSHFARTIGGKIPGAKSIRSLVRTQFWDLIRTRESHDSSIRILYGAESIGHASPYAKGISVALEHGTLRWFADGPRNQRWTRRGYGRALASASLIWLTNLDQRSLEVAEDVAPNRWVPFPHPYVPMLRNQTVQPDLLWRSSILEQTGSEFLIMMPSSINWSSNHNKGTLVALEAFGQLRSQRVPVALQLSNWGLDIPKARAWIESRGLQHYVVWDHPQPRINLARRMASADLVWDQFGLSAFGALALRVCEVGVPLISSPLSSDAVGIVGFQVPWYPASTAQDIVHWTKRIIESRSGPDASRFTESYRRRAQAWLAETHAPRIAQSLQEEAYSALLGGETQLRTDSWKNTIHKFKLESP